jgi:hypothetical protein
MSFEQLEQLRWKRVPEAIQGYVAADPSRVIKDTGLELTIISDEGTIIKDYWTVGQFMVMVHAVCHEIACDDADISSEEDPLAEYGPRNNMSQF